MGKTYLLKGTIRLDFYKSQLYTGYKKAAQDNRTQKS